MSQVQMPFLLWLNVMPLSLLRQDDDPNALWERDDVEESEKEDVRER